MLRTVVAFLYRRMRPRSCSIAARRGSAGSIHCEVGTGALSCAAKNTIIMGGLRMNWTAVACIALVAGCANSPAPENQSAPGASRPGVDERREARALEQAESDCASQGKRAVARREEGETFYDCVDK
jgi:hypothetical protein